MTWRVSSNPVDFDEAVAWFRNKLPMTDAQYQALSADARRKAFTVANVAQLDVVNAVHKEIDKALTNGTGFNEFKANIALSLRPYGIGGHQLETIFRTNVQSAYGAGRYKQMTEPDVLKERPMWVFDAVLDNRTSRTCGSLNGLTLPANDPAWSGRIPPLHHRCRSGVRNIRLEDAQVSSAVPAYSGSDGFGQLPGASEWQPDLSKYPPLLAQALAGKLATLEARNLRGQPPPEPPKMPTLRPLTTQPQGTPVSQALEVPVKPAFDVVRNALVVIDRVHGDGVLEPISVILSSKQGILGEYGYREDTGSARSITIRSKAGVTEEIDVFHEVGHLLHHRAIGTPGTFNLFEKYQLEPWWELVKGTQAYQAVAALRGKKVALVEIAGRNQRVPVDQRTVEYLLEMPEFFARSYAQYVAISSGDERIVGQLARRIPTPGQPLVYHEQWADDDFEPIAQAFDALFRELRWTR